MIDATQNSLWGIVPDVMQAMLASARSGVQMLSQRRSEEDKNYEVQDGVAVITIAGALVKRPGWYSSFWNSRAYTTLAQTVMEALEDPQVDAMVLDIDSPGGMVSGVDAFTDVVNFAAEQIPVVAFANGSMCSAAYFAGSAANHIVAERTAVVGSIGVLYVHYDFSEMDKKWGLNCTVMTAGEFKAVGNEFEPLSERDRKVIQAELDTFYGIFIDTVAENRGVAKDTVRTQMADGKVFIGAQALDAGLVDEIGTLADAIEAARQRADDMQTGQIDHLPTTIGAAPQKEQTMRKDKQMVAPTTVAELEAQYPELSAELRQQGAQGVDIEAAAAAERQRLMGLVTTHFGAEAGGAFTKIVDAGVTDEQYKAIVGDSAPGAPHAEQIQGKEEILAALKNTGSENPGADNGSENLNNADKDFMALVQEHMVAFKTSKVDAMQAIMKNNPKAHAAYLQKHN